MSGMPAKNPDYDEEHGFMPPLRNLQNFRILNESDDEREMLAEVPEDSGVLMLHILESNEKEEAKIRELIRIHLDEAVAKTRNELSQVMINTSNSPTPIEMDVSFWIDSAGQPIVVPRGGYFEAALPSLYPEIKKELENVDDEAKQAVIQHVTFELKEWKDLYTTLSYFIWITSKRKAVPENVLPVVNEVNQMLFQDKTTLQKDDQYTEIGETVSERLRSKEVGASSPTLEENPILWKIMLAAFQLAIRSGIVDEEIHMETKHEFWNPSPKKRELVVLRVLDELAENEELYDIILEEEPEVTLTHEAIPATVQVKLLDFFSTYLKVAFNLTTSSLRHLPDSYMEALMQRIIRYCCKGMKSDSFVDEKGEIQHKKLSQALSKNIMSESVPADIMATLFYVVKREHLRSQ